MRKLALTVVLCLIASISFGQKKAVKEAKSEIKNSNPNIGDARNFIKGALNDPETKDQAETWFVAGSVENKQFDMENTKLFIPGGTANEEVMYGALDAIFPYFLKSYELDNLPNEKGKVKPEFTKNIKSIMRINRDFYISAASYFFDKKEWEKSYNSFKIYLDLPSMPLMSGETFVAPADTFIAQIKFYAALSATQIPDHQAAIGLLTEIKNGQYREIDVYKQLSSEYDQLGDSVALLQILKEGVTKFSGDEYFLLILIDRCIQSRNLSDAIDYIKVAIDQNPNDVVFHDVLGVIYENSNESEKARQSYEKALSIDPTYTKAIKHFGMFYYNEGVKARGEADDIHDKKLYDEAYAKSLEFYKKAIPFLENAFSVEPDRDVIFCLRGIYYSLGMGDEFDKMDALYTGGTEQ
jgi:tetratricopeptide (TPR) repeat protein